MLAAFTRSWHDLSLIEEYSEDLKERSTSSLQGYPCGPLDLEILDLQHESFSKASAANKCLWISHGRFLVGILTVIA